MKRSLAASVAVTATLALALFTGAALAGGHDGADSGSASHGQDTHAAPQQSHSSQQVQTGGDNSHGVKPSSTTSHDTHATAGSGYTKQYGNGKTAGQIVEQRGASSDTVLHGPGNSQPHKVASCAGGHEVDVHAYKGGSACGTESALQQHMASARHEVEHVQKQVEHAVQSERKSVETHKTVETQKTEVQSSSTEQRTHYEAHDKVYICHATGSATNPYVLIHVSKNALWAHTRHQDGRDIVLGDTLSSGSGCPTSAPAAATQSETKSTEAPTKSVEAAQTCTQQEQVQVADGVKHYVGPKGSGNFVVIHPSTKSVHYDNKHPDEINWVTKTISVTVPCTQAPTNQTAAPAVQSAVQSQAPTQTPAPTQAPAPNVAPSTGGVAGVQATIQTHRAAAKPATHGVLGAQATLRPRTRSGGVLGTIRSTTLPFTGLPLWPVVLGGLALIGAGAAVRRAQHGQA